MIKHSGAIVANTLSVVCALFFILPGVAAAGEFVPLVGIPGIGEGEMDEGFGVYINALYILAISIAGLLAVIKLIIAGTKYMLSDIVTQKQDAKSDIKGALLGLLIVLGAVVILTTINEDLLNTDVGVGVLPNLDGRDLVVAEFITAQQICDSTDGCRARSCFGCSSARCEFVPNRFLPGGTCYETTPPLVSGPDSCPEGQSISQQVTLEGTTVNTCIPNEENTTIDLPTQDIVEPGETLRRQIINIICTNPGGCVNASGFDNETGVASAGATCDNISSGRGEFTVTSPTQGTCSWSE